MANSVDPDQTALIGAVCSGSILFASILNSSLMLGKYLQQTTSADDIFRCIFFNGALRAKDQGGGFLISINRKVSRRIFFKARRIFFKAGKTNVIIELLTLKAPRKKCI